MLLQILAVLEMLALAPDPLGPDAALLAEIFVRCAADRDKYLADPRRAGVPIEDLLSEMHLRELCEKVRRGVEPGPAPGSHRRRPRGDTVAVVAADARGWAVSLLQSVFHSFGAAILEPATGIVCQNRGAAFSLDPTSPNVIEGGKRPAHTLMPVLVQRDGRLRAVAGTMGGQAQPQIHAQLLTRALDEGRDPWEAVEAPRWVLGRLESGATAETVFVEARAANSSTFEGWSVAGLKDFDEEVGHAQLILVGATGALEAASDPRSDGASAAG